ncbi:MULTISPECIES: hypothetical protein [unclassified Sphingomonas]|uniref:hypothetical protein n=1 Tax=unclassified Sphingomonas TaxID=196159 RepID=UPI00138F31C4|nr:MULTISPECIES: hypothetical protein [unclassified Sphingomonas]
MSIIGSKGVRICAEAQTKGSMRDVNDTSAISGDCVVMASKLATLHSVANCYWHVGSIIFSVCSD